MKAYLESKLLELKRFYNAEYFLNNYCGNDLKREWNRDREEVKKQWATVMSMDDIQKYVDAYDIVVDRYLTNSGVDIYYVNLTLLKLTYAIEKMTYCYDNDRCDFHFNDIEEIDSWFAKLHEQIESMQSKMHRKSIVGDY
ncbi:MAG: hypothetical protein IJX92_07670 [Clostridia bacterium]|nr:hypothetical protein [Clostridia bacterium]